MKIYWGLGVLMFLLAIASLFTLPPLAAKASVIFLLILGFCIGMTIFYDKDLNQKYLKKRLNDKVKWKVK